jgi:hypothetical protein
VPQFYRRGVSGAGWERGPRAGEENTAARNRFARLLMQTQGSQQVSPQSAESADAVVCFAGVAQLVEHLFCKQVVRGSSPRASSAVGPRAASTVIVSKVSESCPSGQREQAVNLPDLSYAGSNPALSTSAAPRAASVSIIGLGERSSPSTNARGTSLSAGVAQLVERQPSKLNVEGSSPFSRSVRSSHAIVTETHAHLAQLVEHVLGKDEVISSILMVGSKH